MATRRGSTAVCRIRSRGRGATFSRPAPGSTGWSPHLAVDGRGLPLAIVVTPGNVNDSTVFDMVLDAVSVPRLSAGRPRRRPETVIADKTSQADKRQTAAGIGHITAVGTANTHALPNDPQRRQSQKHPRTPTTQIRCPLSPDADHLPQPPYGAKQLISVHPLFFAGNPGLRAGRECGPRSGGAKRRRSLRLCGDGHAGRFWFSM
ncbi:transposase [Streptomyces avermitilis]|uniref:transposase n=1 Tax=Streptomyces avermitilis TaxID=33903 RepID=UPI0033AACF3F